MSFRKSCFVIPDERQASTFVSIFCCKSITCFQQKSWLSFNHKDVVGLGVLGNAEMALEKSLLQKITDIQKLPDDQKMW
ncbi:MAG: hypothetical protein ACOC3T_02880 [Bacteroidota bacterium]